MSYGFALICLVAGVAAFGPACTPCVETYDVPCVAGRNVIPFGGDAEDKPCDPGCPANNNVRVPKAKRTCDPSQASKMRGARLPPGPPVKEFTGVVELSPTGKGYVHIGSGGCVNVNDGFKPAKAKTASSIEECLAHSEQYHINPYFISLNPGKGCIFDKPEGNCELGGDEALQTYHITFCDDMECEGCSKGYALQNGQCVLNTVSGLENQGFESFAQVDCDQFESMETDIQAGEMDFNVEWTSDFQKYTDEGGDMYTTGLSVTEYLAEGDTKSSLVTASDGETYMVYKDEDGVCTLGQPPLTSGRRLRRLLTFGAMYLKAKLGF